MKTIEHCLNEVCTISTEGKLNSEQKLKISSLCRKVGHCTSQLVVEYQALKQKAIQNYMSNQDLKDKLDLSLQLQELKQCVEESTKACTKMPSFAEMIKKNTNNYVQPSNISSVAIYPTDKLKSSEETKSLVQTIIKPEEMKLHVRGLRKIRNGGVVISTDSKDDILKLKQSAQLTTSGLTVDEPQKRKPRIVIIGVPATMHESEVFKCIYQQNLADKMLDMSLESFSTSTRLSHKSGKKDAETCNYILEVPTTIRRALITSERVFVNWTSCPVRDFTLVTRCYKCQQYGHAAKSCKSEVDVCGHCGVNGHVKKDCTKKTEPPKCATCLRFKKPCDHETGIAECPARKSAERRPDSGSSRMTLSQCRQLECGVEGGCCCVTCAGGVVAYCTLYACVVGWDLRAPGNAWKLQGDLKQGVYTCMFARGGYLAAGTSNGAVCVWDLRFQLPITSVRHPNSERVRRIVGFGGAQSSRVWALGARDAAAWCLESTQRTHALWPAAAGPAPLDYQAPASQYLSAAYAGSTDGQPWLVTGGSDQRLRCWQLARAEDSLLLVPPAPPQQHRYRSRIIDGTTVIQEYCKPAQPAPVSIVEDNVYRAVESRSFHHTAPITDITMVEGHGHYLVSSSADGVINVWK